MATREDNIKKINDELEKLDDEQLEQIAGGLIVRYIPPGYQLKPINENDKFYDQN